jgi:iron(III) transport system permease protein
MANVQVTAAEPRSIPEPRRELLPAGVAQAGIWLFVVLCVIGPFLPLLLASVRDRPLYEAGGVLTLRSYQQLFSDAAFWRATANTLEFAAMGTLFAVVGGASLAVLCSRTDMPGRRTFSRIVLVPIALPGLALILAWTITWGPGGYLSNFSTQRLHVQPWDLARIPGMAFLGGVVALPVVFLICQAALARSDAALEDAARSAGASPLRVLLTVTVPLLRPALLNSGLLVFTLLLETLGIPLLLGSTHNIEFISSYLYHTWTNAQTPDPGTVSAGAMVLLLVASLLLVLRNRLLGAESRFVSSSGSSGADRHLLRIGALKYVFAAVIATYLLLTTFMPLIGLALASGVDILTPLIAPWHVLTLDHYRALGEVGYRNSIGNSVMIALVGAIVTTAIVALATLVAHRSRFPLRHSLQFALLYPRAIPGLIIGIGFFWAFILVDPPGNAIRNSIWGIMLAFVIHSFTLSYVVLAPTLARIAGSLDNASRAAGAAWWETSRRIVLPLMLPAILGSFLLVFVAMINSYEPALFLVRPGNEVIGVTMLNQFEQGIIGPVSALAVVDVAITAIVLGVGALLVKRLGRKVGIHA